MTGKFITLEGTEGVGKSTNMQCIEQWLAAQKIDFITTREPGGTALGEKIRVLLLSERTPPLDAVAELLLIFAARAQHLSEVIVPALKQGKWVLCDRFTDATYAYQGSGRGLDSALIATLEAGVHGDLQPDLTLFLDVDPAIGLARVDGRGERDRFEKEQIAFFLRVRDGYRERAVKSPHRFRVIDASLPPHRVAQAITEVLNEFGWTS